MAIPDYQTLMLPVLKIAADGSEHYTRDTITRLAEQFGLTEAERKQMLASGAVSVFDDRFGWARYYLKRAGLLQNPRRGYFQITDQGRTVLAQNPTKIDVKLLRQFLARVKACPPDFFERLVVLLLTTMGYGGSLADAGKAIGKSGDGSVDGVIKEDKLGLDLLYIQAKRWDASSVGRPEIQTFVRALHGKRARKGIFITTSTFTREARDYAEGLETKVILMDGGQLAELMLDYSVGVATANSYVVKRIDSDFFEDEIVTADHPK